MPYVKLNNNSSITYLEFVEEILKKLPITRNILRPIVSKYFDEIDAQPDKVGHRVNAVQKIVYLNLSLILRFNYKGCILL
jgi:hypothetical protein